MKLWPRLPLPRACAIAESYNDRALGALAAQRWQSEESKLFAPTGGVRVGDEELSSLRRELEGIANEAGYPTLPPRAAKKRFDDGALVCLTQRDIPIGEALRPEMWAWVCVTLVPHVIKWRWAAEDKVKPERYGGSLIRNALGRLWYEGYSLDRGKDHPERWLHARNLGADQAVALLERPSLSSDPQLCRSIAAKWSDMPLAEREEALFREAMKAMVVRAAVQRLDVLDSTSVRAVVDEIFLLTRKRIDT